MNFLTHYFDGWSTKEKIWLAFVLAVQTIAWFIQSETFFMLAMTLSSSLNLVLGAKGKVEGLYFAIINSVLYAIQCYEIPLYGEVMYNILYSIPVSAASIYFWKQNMASNGEVKFRILKTKGILITLLITIVGIALYTLMLQWMGGKFAFMDSVTTVIAVVASFMYMKRYSEQWLMWVLVNATEIIMWIMVLFSGGSIATLIIIMKAINLANSCYGYFNWRKISKEVNAQDM